MGSITSEYRGGGSDPLRKNSITNLSVFLWLPLESWSRQEQYLVELELAGGVEEGVIEGFTGMAGNVAKITGVQEQGRWEREEASPLEAWRVWVESHRKIGRGKGRGE